MDAQRLLGLPVRMGVATGEVEQRGEDYFGPALNRAARVIAVGHGGQILVSGVAAGLVESAGLWRQVRVGVGTCCWARRMSAVEGLELG